MVQVIHTLCLIHKTLLHHHVHSPVDTREETGSLPHQSKLDYAERSFFHLVDTQRTVGSACHVTYLQSMDDSLVVMMVNDFII